MLVLDISANDIDHRYYGAALRLTRTSLRSCAKCARGHPHRCRRSVSAQIGLTR